jgi:hypothetical protein
MGALGELATAVLFVALATLAFATWGSCQLIPDPMSPEFAGHVCVLLLPPVPGYHEEARDMQPVLAKVVRAEMMRTTLCAPGLALLPAVP